jgi:hypothetical protein
MTPARVPAFEEVEPEVRSAWVAEQCTEFKRQAFEAMKARYEIVLPKAPAREAPLAVVPRRKGTSERCEDRRVLIAVAAVQRMANPASRKEARR